MNPPRGARRHHPARSRRSSDRVLAMLMVIGKALATLLRPFGVDRARFLALLQARLAADFARGQKDEADGRAKRLSGSLVLTLVMHLLVGIVLALVLHEFEDPRVGLFWTFAAIMAVVTVTLMTEQSSALFETNDLAVIGPLPVTGRTVLAARIAHMLTYFILLVGSLGIAPLLAGTARFGPLFVPGFVLALGLGSVTCMSAAIALLLLTLRFVAASRVRFALLLANVVASAAAVLAWQVIPRLAQLPTTWLVADSAVAPWLLPPAHCAALVLHLAGSPTPAPLGQALLALTVPAMLLAVIATSSRRFQELLLAMVAAERTYSAPTPRRFFRDLLLRDPEAKLGYDFAAALTAREQIFRMRVWPALLMGWLFAAWLVWDLRGGRVMREPAMACAALYMMALMMPQVLTCARFSEHWQARQVFRTHPLQRPGQVVAGALLALILRFCVPATLITFAVTLLLGGITILPDAIFALLVVAVLLFVSLRTHERRLPFTEKFRASELQGSMVRGMLFMLLAGLLAGAHAWLRERPEHFYTALGGLGLVVVVQAATTMHTLRSPGHLGLAWGDERA